MSPHSQARHRSLHPLVVAGAVLFSASSSHGYELGGATIDAQLELPDDSGDFKPRDETTEVEYFNMANCVCEAPFQVQLTLQDDPGDLDTEEVEIWVGSQCDAASTVDRAKTCKQLPSVADVNDLRSPTDIRLSTKDLAATNLESCGEINQDRNVYALIDEQNDGIGTGDHSFPLAIAVDTQAPPEPECISASAAESAVLVTWDAPSSREDDIAFVQLLCARVDGQPLSSDVSNPDPRYLTSNEVCGVRGTSVKQACACGGSDTSCTETNLDSLPAALANLDASAVCGEVVGGSLTSLRATNLENGTGYHLVLVVVDQARNANPFYLGVVTPKPVQDAWEHYKTSGGTALGGCASGTSSGLWALWVGLVLLGLRARKRVVIVAAALLTLPLLGTPAWTQPYWDEYNEPVELVPTQPQWNLAFSVGPFTPDIDSEFADGSGEAGPFARVFGDGRFWLTQATVERYFVTHVGSTRIGQLGLSATAGFLTTGANAFVVDDSGMVVEDGSGRPIRSEGDRTKLRLVPTSLGVVYRMTALDDAFSIPLVPYGKLGLSYYMWWITGPDGSISRSTSGECADSTSSNCRARGGSLGWQASVGMALRAESLDPDTETSLRTELGIEHAGFFAELVHADVDGFGSDDKLSLGDTTLLGGINFEF